MRFLCAIFTISLLSACAPKDNSDFNDSSIDLGGGPEVVIAPVAPKTKNTLIRITCEMNQEALMLQFLDSRENESKVALDPALGSAAESPLLLTETSAFVSNSTGSYITQWGVRGEQPIFLGKLPPFKGVRSTLAKLSMGKPRAYALSPDHQKFIVATNGAYYLRAVAEPQKDIQKWKIASSHFNPRWESGINATSDFVFFDYVEDGMLRQAFARTLKGKLVEFETLNAIGSSYQQLGLRRYDAENFIWLEWKKGKAVARLMNIYSRQVFNLKVPAVNDFSPGFAVLHEDRVGNLMVLPSLEGISFFRLRKGEMELTLQMPFGNSIKAAFASGAPAAQLFAAADDTQVFLQAPILKADSSIDFAIFGLEEGKSFRRLGRSSCLNPGFYEELK